MPFLIRACLSLDHHVPFSVRAGHGDAAIIESSVIPTKNRPRRPPLAPAMSPRQTPEPDRWLPRHDADGLLCDSRNLARWRLKSAFVSLVPPVPLPDAFNQDGTQALLSDRPELGADQAVAAMADDGRKAQTGGHLLDAVEALRRKYLGQEPRRPRQVASSIRNGPDADASSLA